MIICLFDGFEQAVNSIDKKSKKLTGTLESFKHLVGYLSRRIMSESSNRLRLTLFYDRRINMQLQCNNKNNHTSTWRLYNLHTLDKVKYFWLDWNQSCLFGICATFAGRWRSQCHEPRNGQGCRFFFDGEKLNNLWWIRETNRKRIDSWSQTPGREREW